MTKIYEKYKDSGVAWIGEIPDHWEIKRTKNIVSLISKGTGITKDEVFLDGDTPCVRYGEIYTKYNNSFDFCISKTKKDVLQNYRYFHKGDILCAGTGELVEEIGKSIVYTGSEECLAGGDIIVLSPTQNSVFLNYLLNSQCIQAQKSCNKAKLKVVHISATDIGCLQLCIPPLSEQQSIASFLDEKCGEIDSLIALQEEMITELQDYKQSVISEVVTKGLDPNAQMKDSGVEWIGEIPEGWKVYPFKSIFKTSKGLNITKADLTEKGIPVINYGQIHSKNNPGTRIIKELIRYVPEKYIASNPECLLPVGSILFADTSEDIEGCGNAVYIDQSDIIFAGYHTVVAKPNNSSNKYIAYQLLTDCWKSQIRSVVNGIKVLSINQKFINSTSIIFPPLSEQQQIATYLDEKTQQIDTLITLKQQKIEELKDYKKSIIYEYVTGKKKV